MDSSLAFATALVSGINPGSNVYDQRNMWMLL